MPEAPAKEVQRLLRPCTDHRVASHEAGSDAQWAKAVSDGKQLQRQIWTAVAEATRRQPALAVVLPLSFNEMFDLDASRVTTAQYHLPGLLLLLLASSAVSVAAVGYVGGGADMRNVVLTTVLSFLIGGLLWAVIDMDRPRNGLRQVGQHAMLDLQ